MKAQTGGARSPAAGAVLRRLRVRVMQGGLLDDPAPHGGVSAGTKVAFYRVRLARRRKQPIQCPITCVM
jgi:hypothetical protein